VKVHTAKSFGSQVLSILEPDCQKTDRKKKKDWPPIHSRDQSLRIILLSGKGFLFDLFAESLACFELNDLCGGNLDLLSGTGIAAFTLRPCPDTESPETYQLNLLTASKIE